jgi:hypothetical protein
MQVVSQETGLKYAPLRDGLRLMAIVKSLTPGLLRQTTKI